MTHPQSPLRLSVCIPTHHGRRAELQQAIESILPQITGSLRGQVEICVGDNASEDGTQALMERFIQENPDLFVYCRHPENLGFARNLLHIIRMAQGDFCWLLSSDDMMAEQGLARVLAAFAQNPGLAGLTVDLRYWNRSMTHCLRENMPAALLPCRPEQAQVFTSPAQIFRECGSVQGGFSMQAFDRKLFLEVLGEVGDAKCVSFRYFPYLYLFGKMVKKRPAWLWLPEKLIQSRGDNDSLSRELNQNALKYQTVVMEELHRIWSSLFGASSATCQSLMRANFSSFWNGPALLAYKSRYSCTAADERRALWVWTRCLCFLPAFWLTSFPVLLMPGAGLRPAVLFLRRMGLTAALRAGKRRLIRGTRSSGRAVSPEPL